MKDATGAVVALPGSSAVTVDVRLPVLAAPAQPGGVFAWLQAIYDPSGAFLGYIRPAAAFDPSTNSVTLQLSPAALQGTLFLPAVLTPAWLSNFDAAAHLFSGPTAEALDFGPIGRQFATLVVVAPQVAGRVYVYDTAGNYGWVDAAAVGPTGPPAQS